ncbi:unnamed protein product [Calypogeia fissa]
MDSPSSTGRQATDSYASSVRRSSNNMNNYDLASPSIGAGSSKRSFSMQARQALSADPNAPGQEFDASQYGQSLASVLNNPKLGKAGIYASDASWGSWLFQGSNDPFVDAPPPPLPPGTLQEVTRADFRPYLEKVSEHYSRFVDVRQHLGREQSSLASSVNGAHGSGEVEGRVGHGEGLVACLQEIPSLYFDEDFALEKGSTFDAACPFASIPQNMLLQEKLSHYLDLVEVHLVREISARSDSFFDALGQLEDLNAQIVQACDQIRELQSTVQLLDGDLVESASRLQNLGLRRDTFLALHQKLKLVASVNQALSALRLLVSEADCAGALDVVDNLQFLLDGDDLVGLHCFRRLSDQLASAMDSINSTLAADFVRAAIHETGDLETSAIINIFHARVKDYPASVMDMAPFEAKREDEDESGLRDQLLPTVIGLLRTSKLPAVLRVYRDTLITDIKAAIKTVVAELLPTLFTRPPEGGDLPSADRQADLEVGGLSLAYKLRSLSAESFVQLLIAVFGTVQARMVRAAEVRSVVEQIIGGLKGSYAAAAVAAAFASGAAAAAAAEAALEGQQDSLYAGSEVLTNANHDSSLSKANTVSNSSISKQFRADVLRENTEAVCAACDAAHGRWAKLLGVRALVHPKLRLQEFVSIYKVTQDFISATEKVGGRLGYSIRGTLQSQAKSFVDNQHSIRISKITAVLEQETWVSVDTPDEFQEIVNSLTTVEVSGSDNLVSGDLAQEEEESLEQLDKTEPSTSAEGVGVGTVAVSNQENGLFRQESVDEADRKTEGEIESQPLPSSQELSDTANDASQNTLLPGHPEATVSSGHPEGTVSSGHPEGTVSSANGIQSKPAVQPPLHGSSDNGGEVPGKAKKRDKPSLKTLHVRGQSYHAVNCGLILLKMIAEYVDISNALPTLATEVVHRVAELLKLYNSRSCQLVLGAGAMQVSGLKSITAKHLALASQTISFVYAIIPDIRRLLSQHIPEARKGLVLNEIDRVGQDYRVHRDEIHSKLVQIMKERVIFHLRAVPQAVENWNKVDDNDTQPSPWARALVKEVGVLHRVLSPLLLEADVRSIFTRVIAQFHTQISDAFSKVEVTTPHGKRRMFRDIQHILGCTRGLPSDDVKADGTQKSRELDEFLSQRYGIEVAP